jgi:hypothetical protein
MKARHTYVVTIIDMDMVNVMRQGRALLLHGGQIARP